MVCNLERHTYLLPWRWDGPGHNTQFSIIISKNDAYSLWRVATPLCVAAWPKLHTEAAVRLCPILFRDANYVVDIIDTLPVVREWREDLCVNDSGLYCHCQFWLEPEFLCTRRTNLFLALHQLLNTYGAPHHVTYTTLLVIGRSAQPIT